MAQPFSYLQAKPSGITGYRKDGVYGPAGEQTGNGRPFDPLQPHPELNDPRRGGVRGGAENVNLSPLAKIREQLLESSAANIRNDNYDILPVQNPSQNAPQPAREPQLALPQFGDVYKMQSLVQES